MKIFDSHLHIIHPSFPLQPNQGYLPSDFTVDRYLKILYDYEIEPLGGAVVSGSFQGYDQEYLIESLKRLSGYIGVTQLPFSVSNTEISQLHGYGIRAIRFNLYCGGSKDLKSIESLSRRVYQIAGWSTEFYLDISTINQELEELILSLPRVSIDHLGMTLAKDDKLMKFVKNGIKIKATGFGRIDFHPLDTMKKIYAIAPDALLFGTDLPSTRSNRPFSKEDIELIANNFPIEGHEQILFKNAQEWYMDYFL